MSGLDTVANATVANSFLLRLRARISPSDKGRLRDAHSAGLVGMGSGAFVKPSLVNRTKKSFAWYTSALTCTKDCCWAEG